MSVAPAAKLIRQELKAAFAGVKFSVISDNNSVRVSYSDGPTTEDVEAIIGKYQEGSFNGMEDIYEYTNRQDFAQARYVFIDREWTMETKQYAFRILGIAQENELDWRSDDRCNNSEYARRWFSKTTFTAPGVEQSFTPIQVDDCLRANPFNHFKAFWSQIPELVKIVKWAVKKGFLAQHSATQIEWTELGSDWTRAYLELIQFQKDVNGVHEIKNS